MKIDILTLFPNMFDGFLSESIIKRAIEKEVVEINVVNFRKYSKLNNSQVDDTPFGGGAGMVMMCDPVVKAINRLCFRTLMSANRVCAIVSKNKRCRKFDTFFVCCGAVANLLA